MHGVDHLGWRERCKRPASKSALKASSWLAGTWEISMLCVGPLYLDHLEMKGYTVEIRTTFIWIQMSDRLQEMTVFVRVAESGSFSQRRARARPVAALGVAHHRRAGGAARRQAAAANHAPHHRHRSRRAVPHRAREVLAEIEDAEDAARGIDRCAAPSASRCPSCTAPAT